MTDGSAPRPAPSSRRGPYAKTVARRQEIARAALAVFAQHGYHEGSIREIADRVGLSDAGVLHHFPTRDDLLIAAVEYRESLTRDPVLAADLRGSAALDALPEIAAANARMPGVVRMYAACMVEASAAGHVAHDFFRERAEYALDFTRRAFADAAAEGILRADLDAETAATMTLAMMDGLQFQWLYEPQRVDMPAVLSRFIDSLLVPLSDAG